VDFEAAKEQGRNVIWALSIPGRVAPFTSGEILRDTVENIFDEINRSHDRRE
jgi:dipicolinate synthase subunit A